MKETLFKVINKIKHSFGSRLELKTDNQSWNDLVKNKLTEAKTKGLPSRFVYLKQGIGDYFTISTKGSRIFIFEHLDLDNEENSSTSQAIVLEADKEPLYAFEVEALKHLPKYWSLSDKGENLDMIGISFNNLKEARLFNPRKNDYCWKGLVPDVDGLIKTLGQSLLGE